jgi:hypothetical protein
MALQPVEATLIAASVGAVASTAAVVITHLMTRARDRQHRLWDRRMDTYKHVLRSRRDLAFARSQFLDTKANPAELMDAQRELKEFSLIEAELYMFGSRNVNAINLAAHMIFNKWTKAAEEWREFHNQSSDGTEARRMADEKWEQIKSLIEAADRIDSRLTEAIKAEAEFRTLPKREWWRAPFQRRAIKS